MQNDISLEQVKKDNTLREERLQKMKSKIQALQFNVTKTKMLNNQVPRQVQPINIYDHMHSFESKNRSPGHQSTPDQFGYNSTLFKNIDNESQQVMNNGSGVSNFSSVSNINNILNNQHRGQYRAHFQPVQERDSLIEDIDKVLLKVQNKNSQSGRTYEKMMEKQSRPNRRGREEDMVNSMKSNKSGQISARTRLQEYKQLVNKLDTIQEQNLMAKKQQQKQQPSNKKYFEHQPKAYAKTALHLQLEQPISSRKNNNEPSSYRSEYPLSESKFPPTPPVQPKRPPTNAVERQKMLLKQSVIQYKKLQTQSSHEILDKSQIDFQLSDQEGDHKSQHKKQQLLHEKQLLQKQLKQIEKELKEL